MYKILEIKQLADFNCVGGECIDTCCHSWNININKSIYKKYAKTKGIGSKKLRIIDRNNSNNYATMILDGDKSCPFLNKGNLCSIQQEHGVNMLSNTCKTYPRKALKFNNAIEKTFALSCPSVVEMLLKSEDSLEFNMYDKTDNKAEYIAKDMDILNTNGISQDACFNLRSLAITIVQDRRKPLKERIYALGQVSAIIQNLIEHKYTSEEINAYIVELEQDYNSEELLKYTGESIFNGDVKYDLLSQISPLVKSLVSDGTTKNTSKFGELFKEYLASEEPINSNKIKVIKKEVFEKFLIENEYIFENLFVYKLFAYAFPKKNDNIEEAFKYIVTKILLLEILALNVFKEESEISKEDMINAIYIFERQVEHSEMKNLIVGSIYDKLNLHWIDIMELIF